MVSQSDNKTKIIYFPFKVDPLKMTDQSISYILLQMKSVTEC